MIEKEEVFADLRQGVNKATQAALPYVARGAEVVLNLANSLIRKEGDELSQPLVLTKGQVLNLTKATGGMTRFVCNLAWDKGTDLDVSAIPLSSDGKNMLMPIVYYGNLEAPGIKHSGDLRDGGEEEITIDTSLIKADKILIAITSHSQKADASGNQVPGDPDLFGVSTRPTASLRDDKGNVLVISRLNEDASLSTAVEFIMLERKPDGDWNYVSVVNPLGRSAYGLQELVNKYPQ